jgi:hypothetical protein
MSVQAVWSQDFFDDSFLRRRLRSGDVIETRLWPVYAVDRAGRRTLTV